MIKDGVNGILVPPGSPKYMVGALLELLTNSEIREKLSKVAKESVRDYAWNKIAEKYKRIYDEILCRRGEAHV